MADWISTCYAKLDSSVLNSFSILRDLNLIDVCWATVIGYSDYSKRFLLITHQINLNAFVFEPTYKSGCTLDVIPTADSKLLNVNVE